MRQTTTPRTRRLYLTLLFCLALLLLAAAAGAAPASQPAQAAGAPLRRPYLEALPAAREA